MAMKLNVTVAGSLKICQNEASVTRQKSFREQKRTRLSLHRQMFKNFDSGKSCARLWHQGCCCLFFAEWPL